MDVTKKPSGAAVGSYRRLATRRAFLKTSAISAGAGLWVSTTPSLSAQRTKASEAIPARSGLPFVSAVEMARLIRQSVVSPLDLLTNQLEQTKSVNAKIDAVECLVEERALREAALAESAIAKKQVDWTRQPLFGVPFSVKDNIDTEGVPTTAGALGLKNRIPQMDATAVRRLREAGAILIAKSRCPFEACSFEAGNLMGRARNPYDLERTPGGSSGGDAALVAAGGSGLGLGNDAGASIRVPGHYSGIATLVPSYGRVSVAGVFPPDENVGSLLFLSIGPMARYVEDLAMTLPVISGVDYRDPFTFELSLRDWRRIESRDLRVAWWTGDEHFEPTAETLATIENASRVMRSLGSRVSRVAPPYNLRRAKDIILSVHAPGLSAALATEMAKYGSEKDPDMLRAIEILDKWMASVSAEAIAHWKQEVPALRQAVMASMEHFDALLTPVTLTPARRHGETWDHVVNDFVYPEIMGMVWSFPSGTVRCGSSPEGLPIGVQVVGSPNREDIVLAVMGALERELGGWKKPSL